MGSRIPADRIEQHILLLRGRRVLLDRDLARLYRVKTIALRQQVKRNRARFPDDFLLRLSRKEATALVSQGVIPSARSLGGYLPYAFSQEGVAMLSSVLRSPEALRVNIEIMRAFVRLREVHSSHERLSRRLDDLERRCDGRFQEVFIAIRRLMNPPDRPRRRIGFYPHSP
ncbi:MAG TPA: DNA-binding protein [Elusimicrobia bacterium]|nr:DNA-binding protein [Elusimicrobiota bacterium]